MHYRIRNVKIAIVFEVYHSENPPCISLICDNFSAHFQCNFDSAYEQHMPPVVLLYCIYVLSAVSPLTQDSKNYFTHITAQVQPNQQ